MRLALVFVLVGSSLCLVAGCGGTQEVNFNGSSAPATATVLIRQNLFQAVPGRVDAYTFTGLDASGAVTYGPIELDKASEITLEAVPVLTERLRIEYVDVDLEPDLIMGNHQAELDLSPGEVFVVANPSIDLVTGTTTLDRTILPDATDQIYKRMVYSDAWDTVLREDMATASPERESTRQAIMCVAHLSDVHMVDSESPLRVEFLRSTMSISSQRTYFKARGDRKRPWSLTSPKPWFGTSTTSHSGPSQASRSTSPSPPETTATTAIRTSSSISSTFLMGRRISPSSGNPSVYEGVQDNIRFDPQYWHPEAGTTDKYKSNFGFPSYPNLLQAAVVPFQATGLDVPWYSASGNHDALLNGNCLTKEGIPPLGAQESIAIGDRKILSLPLIYALLEIAEPGAGVAAFLVTWFDPIDITGTWSTFVGAWTSPITPSRTITPDSKRHIFSRKEFAQAHLNSPAVPGPVGHGFTDENILNDTLYYSFEPVPGVLGITLDTVNPGGYADGSLDQAQFAWLEARLKEVHSSYYDASGTTIDTENQDKLVVLFSHHNLETLGNSLPDPAKPDQPRILGPQIRALLHRYPNVVLWMNGHSHVCRIYPRPDSSGRTGGFWEVNTPSHIDFPQQSRVVELVDNRDGTLSIFATLVDHAAPPETPATATPDPLVLAAISRELSANDPLIDNTEQLGTPGDRNVELLLFAPFER